MIKSVENLNKKIDELLADRERQLALIQDEIASAKKAKEDAEKALNVHLIDGDAEKYGQAKK